MIRKKRKEKKFYIEEPSQQVRHELWTLKNVKEKGRWGKRTYVSFKIGVVRSF